MRLALILIIGLFVLNSFAADKKAPPKPMDAKSQNEHSFEDLLVQGKYHFSDEAVTTVEDDKVLDSLIGVRSDFKDRIKQSSGLY